MEKWQKIKEKRYLGCLVRETLKTDHGTQAGREGNTSPMGVMRAPGFLGQMGNLVPLKKAQGKYSHWRNQISVKMKR